MKRFFDILLILLTSPLWLPVIVITSLTVLFVMGHPVFFIQVRPGLKGKPFKLMKFRTMLEGDGSDEQRLTRFGRFLRSASLDELPEFFNILKGDMSLVGPRPLLLRYIPRYTDEQMRRHDVLPGITGWAQVNGRNAISWDDKFNLDLWYVDNHTLWLDCRILFITLWKVIRREGISDAGGDTMEEFKGEGMC